MTVYLVGAGPGDPGLLTRRGASLLARATTVIHDRLVEPGVLALAGEGAHLVDVGKRGDGGPSARQADINELLVEAGRREAVVVRLKGGDPFLLGRGGEEAVALEAAGIPYEVVPGVSAAFGAPAAAGVPVTHRLVASSVAVLSGHDLISADDAGEEANGSDRDWALLGASSATLVVLMGAASRARVAERLLSAGRAPDTPVAVVERATTATQSTIRTTLGRLAQASVAAPATIVVGAVADLRLAGYEDRPLAGKRVVVTRAPGQAGALGNALEEAGAVVIALPTRVTAAPADDGAALRAALGRAGSFAWMVLASPNAVAAVFSVLRDARGLSGLLVAAVGPGTAAALASRGVLADLVAEPEPGQGAAAALLGRFPSPHGAPSAVLLPRAAGGREELAEGLARLGWTVEAVEAYRSVVPPPDPAALAGLGGADAVCFASPSAVEGFVALAGREALPPVVVTIGPTTSAAAGRLGITVHAEAGAPEPAAIVAALQAALVRHRP